ncbi:hypothetical protein FHS31_000127 [Sphingomonas vulcanisoli]|uniref:Uncharacterized protein n=1 Tax=Sphingomonas vulcanisoli TaxID=1658060 RepID=A0ABX0TPK0_9SPHN|nr:hypothetical protein [Sphingomonas vulcanisoli]NIJ06545.1 hypothetical protein [Sphingomonas vulcanisoli]
MVDQRQIIDAGVTALITLRNDVQALRQIRPIEADTEGPPYLLISNPIIPACVERICSSQAQAFNCLFDLGRQRASESSRMHALRLERVNAVRRHCSDIDITNLTQRGVRNALAHFDERLLKALLNPDNKGGWMQDLAASHRAAFDLGPDAEQRMVRAYFYHEDVVYVLGETLRPFAMDTEAALVLARFGVPGLPEVPHFAAMNNDEPPVC